MRRTLLFLFVILSLLKSKRRPDRNQSVFHWFPSVRVARNCGSRIIGAREHGEDAFSLLSPLLIAEQTMRMVCPTRRQFPSLSGLDQRNRSSQKQRAAGAIGNCRRSTGSASTDNSTRGNNGHTVVNGIDKFPEIITVTITAVAITVIIRSALPVDSDSNK